MSIAIGDGTGERALTSRARSRTTSSRSTKPAEGEPRPAETALDAPRHRRHALHDRGDAEVAPDLDQRVRHPGSWSTAADELVFTLANGFAAHVEAAVRPPASRSTTSSPWPSSFFFSATRTSSRRSASSASPQDLGPLDARRVRRRRRALALAAGPRADVGEVPRPRSSRRTMSPWSALQGLAVALGGAQSLHTDSFDEALALPSDKAARSRACAPSRSSPTRPAWPSSPTRWWAAYVGVDDRPARAPGRGGALAGCATGDGSMLEGVYVGIDDGWFVGEIADAVYRTNRYLSSGAARRRRRDVGTTANGRRRDHRSTSARGGGAGS